MFVELDWAA